MNVFLVTAIAMSVAVTAGTDGPSETWMVHDDFEDFAEGTLGDGGVNLYVTKTGGVQMIHRWDLNNDGHLDLLVGQSHNANDNEDAFIYWGTDDGPRSIMPPLPDQQPLGRLLHQWRLRQRGMTRLPSEGGGRSLAVDLNNDGWKEIVFCNFIHNHDVLQEAFIYWGGPEGYSQRRLTRLQTLNAAAVAAADFNRDGFVDLCFANSGSEMGGRFDYHRHLESYIYWNGPRGFSQERRASIPSVSALDCAAGDLNGDSYPDLVVVNGHPEHQTVYIYWNGPEGLSEDRRETREQGTPVAAEILDANNDHRPDLILLDREGRAGVYLATEEGLSPEATCQLPVHEAKSCRAADLNQDGHIDLVFPNQGTPETRESYIYWGAADGFDADNRTSLPGMWTTDACIADFNGDEWDDIALANERDDLTYDVNSYIYWNGPEGFHPAYRSEVQGLGAVSAIADDLNQDDRQDLVLINRYSGATAANTRTPGALVYWGNPRHFYSPAAMTRLATLGDAMVTADYDQNGYLDIAFPNGHLYYGDEDGYPNQPSVDLGLPGYGVSTADLNRDGYLDLVIPTRDEAIILWGGADGFDTDHERRLPLTTRITQAASIADLNKDGRLDLIFPDVDSPRVDIYWGQSDGRFDQTNRTSMDVHSASTVQIADVNADGWLDLIFGGTYDWNNKGRHLTYGVLLYGGEEGYSLDRSIRFEAYDSDEQAVADFNKDGFLDMAISNYHGYTTRSLPVFIYWGNESGRFDASRRATLPAESSLRLTGLDFNKDNWLDLAVFNHQDNGDHTTGANIFWGGPDGFSYKDRDWIQTFGVHFGERHNLGNIYDRRLEEAYMSPPLEIPESIRPKSLHWRARTPHGTSIVLQIRSAESRELLSVAPWRGPEGASSYFTESGAGLDIDEDQNWMQYRALLTTPDGGSTPYLEEVRIDVSLGRHRSD